MHCAPLVADPLCCVTPATQGVEHNPVSTNLSEAIMWWYSKPEKWTVLCADGKFRVATQTAEPDTFFTVPARVQVKGKTVSGFVWYDNSSTETSPNGQWKFTASGWLKNAHMLQWPERQRS